MVGRKTRLLLQRFTDVRDAYSSMTRTWDDKIYLKGVLVPISSNERLSLDKLTVYATHQFFCDVPKEESIYTKDRFKLGSRIFEIKSIDDPDNSSIRYKIILREIV